MNTAARAVDAVVPSFFPGGHERDSRQRDQSTAGVCQIGGPEQQSNWYQHDKEVDNLPPSPPGDKGERKSDQKNLSKIIRIAQEASAAYSHQLPNHLVLRRVDIIL
jgi:hypothetical protein